MSRCTGACCESFTLVVDGRPVTHAEWRDGGFVAGDLGWLVFPAGEESRFDCANFDPRTRLCKDYANRPATCRAFPFEALQDGEISNTCKHCGQTQDSASDCGGEC